ncbi:GNAT family N-acetyltransferase [Micromonospora sp. KC721]|uniref:GNAT family N-acetyltransferase n=1 Tax=Micromonospora sp. KC721 TaxID=2530380 RepID=UPI00104E5EE6|nr:GNAT family N-acetyltransferase [Micromonospora sp. KC721]TDB79478.1 GNAT family N-acetyltransferase [Micromonospora sp. KC721]
MSLMARIQHLWMSLAGVAASFPTSDVRVFVAAESRLCPPGWAGVVVLGHAGIATAPNAAAADILRRSLSGLPTGTALQVERWRGEPHVLDALGPAALAYLDEQEFQPWAGADVDVLPPGHPNLARFVATVGQDEAEESGIDEITSSVFVVRDGTEVTAAAGYRHWPGSVAHLCVLTDSRFRRRGLARTVASSAVADALRNPLLPQWRARPEPSRRLAGRLGFRELGSQMSLLIERPAVHRDSETPLVEEAP